MKSKRMRSVLTVVIILAAIIGLFAFLFWYFFVSMSHLPEGTEINRVVSPDGTYTLVAYYASPATVSGSVRGELVNNETEKKKNIYWRYKCGRADIQWLDESTVIINGTKLDVRYDTYDWRHDPDFQPDPWEYYH